MIRYEVKDGCLHVWIPLKGLPVKEGRMKTCAYFTPRQLEVLRELRKNKTNKEIGDTLGCTERTVKFHIGRLMRIVGVLDRHSLASADMEAPLLQYMIAENKKEAFGSRRETLSGKPS